MKKIEAYKLKGLPAEDVKMPVNADILSAIEVNGEPVVFAVIDPEELKMETRTIYRIATGKPVAEDVFRRFHIGSFTIGNYGVVYHFFTGATPEEVLRSMDKNPVASINKEPKLEVSITPEILEEPKGAQPSLRVSKEGPSEHPFLKR